MNTWDVIVVGGGPPGQTAAQYATQDSDLSAVIVEERLLGGECSFWACLPSKALLRPLEVRAAARHIAGVRDVTGGGPLDIAAVLERRDEIIEHRDDSSQVDRAHGAGIDVVHGRARLNGVRTVDITLSSGAARTIRARHAVVLDTGSTARIPPIPGLREALPWTSADATNLHVVPDRAAVIGGGPAACEAATWLNGLGCEVTVLCSARRLLHRAEPFVGEYVRRELETRGATVRLGVTVERVERADPRNAGKGEIHGGEVVVHVGGAPIVADEVLVAVGRTPNSLDLGLHTVSLASGGTLADAVARDDGFVRVDDHFAVEGVAGDWLFAVGDLNGRAFLTHMGMYQARICGATIAARAQGRAASGPRCTDVAGRRIVPQVIFTDPQVATVGLTEQQAREAGVDVEAVEYDLGALAGTRVQRERYAGRAKIVLDRRADVLVGATFVGPQVAELVHTATLAIVGSVPIERIWHAVPAYPTMSEIWLRLLETR
jgi:dihydrolipoamide dehydrogenase